MGVSPDWGSGGGEALVYFLGGYVPPGTPLKLIPRSRNGPIFLYPVLARIRPKTDTPF